LKFSHITEKYKPNKQTKLEGILSDFERNKELQNFGICLFFRYYIIKTFDFSLSLEFLIQSKQNIFLFVIKHFRKLVNTIFVYRI